MRYHQHLKPAMHEAYSSAPCAIGYRQGDGWHVYDPAAGCPAGSEPEFMVFRLGTEPAPLTETALEAWVSLINEGT